MALPDGFSIEVTAPPPPAPPGLPAGQTLYCYDVDLPDGTYGGLCLDFPGMIKTQDPALYGGSATDNPNLQLVDLDAKTRRKLEKRRRDAGLDPPATYLCLGRMDGRGPIGGPVTVRLCFVAANRPQRIGNVSLAVSRAIRRGSKVIPETVFLGFQERIAVPAVALADPLEDVAQPDGDAIAVTDPVQALDACTIQVVDGDWIVPPLCPVDLGDAVDLSEIFIPDAAALSLTAILQQPLASFNGLDDDQANLLGQALGVETVDELLDNELIGRIVQLRSTGVI